MESSLQVGDIEFLSTEEKSSIPKPVFEKVCSHWNKKIEELSNLQIEFEKTQTNSDQCRFQVEKEIVDLQKALKDESSARENAQAELASLKEKFDSHNEQLENLNKKISNLQQQLQQSQVELEAATEHSSSITANLESKSKLNDELRDQIKILEGQLDSSQRSKCDAVVQIEEANAAKLQIQYKEKRFDQEKSLLTHHMEILKEQLEKRSEDVIELRKEHSSLLLNLQSDLNHSTEEASTLRRENEALLKENCERKEKIESLLISLNETRESANRLEESFKKELKAQEKYSDSLKGLNESDQKRIVDLERAAKELNQMLQKSSEQYGALESAKAHAEKEAEKNINEKNILIRDLKEELDKVNDMLKCSSHRDDDYLSELSPAASVACQLMKKGLTLSQLYSEYIRSTDKLLFAEEENKRLTRYVEQILKEIEEKAPILRRQKDDYERALETINALHAQIDNSIEDLEKQKLEAEEAQRRSNYLGRENELLNKQVKDLGKQVTVLLTQLEAARAGLPPPPLSFLENVSENKNASDIIDQHLVTFRDVSELQEKNTKLLASLRDLTDKLESSEQTAVETKTQELKEELEMAHRELNDLKSARERMEIGVENITRQRDMYRTLLNEQKSTPSSKSRFCGSIEEYENLKQSLEAAKKDAEKLRKEYDEYRHEREKNSDMEKKEYDRLKSHCEKTRSENIKLLSQAEYNEERLKTLQSSCESYQRQVNALEEKNETLQGIVGRHEGTIETLREHTLSLTKKMSHFEVIASNLRDEKTLLKESEARLMAERDNLHRSQYSLSLIMSNMEAIKNNLDKNDSDTRMRYENKISDLTEQCSRLKAKLESNIDVKEAQNRVTTLEEQLRVSKSEAHATKKALSEMEKKYTDLVAQEKAKSVVSPVLNRIRSPMQTSPATTPKSSSMISHTVRELQVQLEEEKARTSSLQTSVIQAQTNIESLKQHVKKQEAQIKDFNETSKAAEKEIESLRKSLEKSEKKLKEFEEKLKNSEESEAALKELMDKRLMDLTKDLEERENELEEAQKKLEDSKKTEVKAREQEQEKSRIALETQTKYEREVMYHAADLEALKTLKNKLANYNSEIEEVARGKVKVEEELREIKTALEAKIEKLETMKKEYNTRIEELEEQNETLLNQFTNLSDKMSSIQMKLSSGAEGVNSSFTEDEARSSEQLLELIKYLRKEKEIAYGKVEVTQSEVVRLETQIKCFEDQVKLLKKHLSEEREKNQASVESVGKYGEMMRKVHTLDALADSNRLLREEKENLKNSLDATNAKIASLESQIEPLHGKLRDMETMVERLTAEKKSLEDEKENFKKRSQELVEKLNKSRPEDMVKLQQEVNGLQKNLQSKDLEINKQKNMLNHFQKNQHGLVANKNQLTQKLNHITDESKKFSEENKKLTQDKIKLQQQAAASIDKMHNLEVSKNQEIQKSKQLLQQISESRQQISESRQREEKLKNEIESLKKSVESKDSSIKTVEGKLVTLGSRVELLHKQNIQLRKIANKYKTKVESNPDMAESSGATGEEETEEKKILRQPDQSSKKEEPAKLMDQVTKLKAEIQKKDEELAKVKSEDEGLVTKLQSEVEAKNQDLQKANSVHIQYKEKVSSELIEMNKKLEESQSKKGLYESRILSLEKEKEQLIQQVESHTKKLSMQQKILENYQKQTSTVQKLSPTGIIEKPSLDTPPTANIKPMAAPIPTSAVPTPRSQGSSQGSGSSRSIPTASIKPMATTSTPTSQTSPSVVAVSPMEAHSGGDGAVSSTVTIPQATVTRTPVAAASTTTQAFPPSLTATVSPTPVSQSSIVSTAPFTQPNVASIQPRQDEHSEAGVIPTPSGSADAIVSQAIALVAPQIEERSSGSQKRKLESVLEREEEEEEELEDAKRTRLLQEESGIEEEDDDEGMEDDDDEDDEDDDDDMGEPSSSSHRDERNIEKEVLVLSSDEENDVPPSQSGREEEDQEESANEGGREAEAEGNEEGEGSSTTPSSSLQPPPRPLHEPPSSSSRQSLAPFHQLPNYEEGGDDRMVPSTPTFVPRPCEGQSGDGVSSPQVPSQGFEFGTSSGEGGPDRAAPSSDGLSQIAEGGVSIDATRMDLAQLDDATHSSVPSAPIQSFPTEQSAEGNISSSGGDGGENTEVSQGRSSPLDPLEEAEEQIERGDDVVSSQDDVEPEIESRQPPEEEEEEESQSSSLQEEIDEEVEDESDERKDEIFPARETRSSSGASQGRSSRTPITWDHSTPARAAGKGRAQSERGQSTGAPARQQPARGTPRGRRSRGSKTFRGGLN